MPIIVRSRESVTVESKGFPLEEDLERAIESNPDLIRLDGDPPLEFIARQVSLDDAGTLDLLLVTADGLPIVVEVKLAKNAQAYREVVAQAIDYISALTTLTNDELDQKVNGALEKALRAFEEVPDDEIFEKRWQDVGTNLRAGLARIVIAMDDAPPRLERIVRFLAENSRLNVQLVTVERYLHEGVGEILVPTVLVGTESDSRNLVPPTLREPRKELLEVVAAYNNKAPEDLKAVGSANNYRQIRPSDWPNGMRTHYEFMQTATYVAADLHIESDKARPIGEQLSALAGKKMLGGKAELIWDPNWSKGRGRLVCRFPLSTEPDDVGEAMRELMRLTHDSVKQRLVALAAGTT